jgi:hypothetical protein
VLPFLCFAQLRNFRNFRNFASLFLFLSFSHLSLISRRRLALARIGGQLPGEREKERERERETSKKQESNLNSSSSSSSRSRSSSRSPLLKDEQDGHVVGGGGRNFERGVRGRGGERLRQNRETTQATQTHTQEREREREREREKERDVNQETHEPAKRGVRGQGRALTSIHFLVFSNIMTRSGHAGIRLEEYLKPIHAQRERGRDRDRERTTR